METHDEKMTRLTKEFLATVEGTDEFEEKLTELLDAMEEADSDPESLKMTVCAGTRSHESAAGTFNDVAKIAYGKLVEWRADDPSLDRVAVTTWEKDGDGESMCELVVRTDKTYTFTYAPMPFLENTIERIEM